MLTSTCSNFPVTYQVINAIAKSGADPRRAENILDKILEQTKAGNLEVRPDVVSFNAVINAFGWSEMKGKSKKCFDILQKMLELSESGENSTARPDIITCNSILDACAFEKGIDEDETEKIMEIVVQTLEIFQTNAPLFGYPDHVTYSKVLVAITKQTPDDDRRYELAEATFWQCCSGGHLSPLVVGNFHLALPWSRFAAAMGSALLSGQDEKLRYDLTKFPREWTMHVPDKKRKQDTSRASRKRNRGYQATKSSLSKPQKGQQ